LRRKYRTLGIDLGTTFSAIAYVDPHGDPRIIYNPEDQRPVLPSVVFFEDDSIIIGQHALVNAKLYPQDVVQCVKRMIGGKETVSVGANNKSWSPEALSSLILKKLKQMAEATVGEVDNVVVTVPAFFNEKRRNCTEQAGKIVGLNVVATLNEPSAALMACGLHGQTKEQIYAVYDLGGGTFDVTIMKVGSGEIDELATAGNRTLGGQDFDEALVNHISEEFKTANGGIDPRDDLMVYQTMLSDCREVKHRLLQLKRTMISVSHAGYNLHTKITRELFEEISLPLLRKTEMTISACLNDAQLTWDKIAGVILIGGSSKMPMVSRMVEKISGKAPIIAVDQEQAVAMGAALYAGVLESTGVVPGWEKPQQTRDPNQPSRLSFVDNSANGTESDDNPNAPAEIYPPGETAESFTETCEIDSEGDSEEIVFGEYENPTPEDSPANVEQDDGPGIQLRLVNSHGIGVFARINDKQVNVVMIPKNSRLPIARKRRFYTPKDNMTKIRVTVSEGDHQMRQVCDVLGKCTMGPLPPGLPKGTPIELVVGYNTEGRVRLSARLDQNGRSTVVAADLDADGLLNPDDIEREQNEVGQFTMQ
jgi:molecular chaperone DnaK